jgi:hypothetical protein
MTYTQRMSGIVLGCMLVAGTASTQTVITPPSGNMWDHGTTLNVFSGAAANAGDRATATGGAFGWELTPHFALEGGGTWLDWGENAHAFIAGMTAHVVLLPPHPLVPFLIGGAGVYRAAIDRPGVSFGSRQVMTFIDPAVMGGAGMSLYVSRHWAVRPELLASIVLRDPRSFVVTTGVVRLAYHFEDHVTAPDRR